MPAPRQSEARGQSNMTPGPPGGSAAPAPAAADSSQVQRQQGQTDEQQAGRVKNRADRCPGGIDDESDSKKNGRNNGEHGRSFRLTGTAAGSAVRHSQPNAEWPVTVVL